VKDKFVKNITALKHPAVERYMGRGDEIRELLTVISDGSLRKGNTLTVQ
jgi:hypothetical protein